MLGFFANRWTEGALDLERGGGKDRERRRINRYTNNTRIGACCLPCADIRRAYGNNAEAETEERSL